MLINEIQIHKTTYAIHKQLQQCYKSSKFTLFTNDLKLAKLLKVPPVAGRKFLGLMIRSAKICLLQSTQLKRLIRLQGDHMRQV